MARQLLKTTNVWLTESEEEAMALIEEAKEGQLTGGYSVTKSGYTMKPKNLKAKYYFLSLKPLLKKLSIKRL